MKILITGGTGFIGRATVRTLADAGHNLMVFTRRPYHCAHDSVQSMTGDLADTDTVRGAVREFGREALVHLAWEGLPDYRFDTSALNLAHGLTILKAAAEAGTRQVVMAGTCWEYEPANGPLSEQAPLSNSSAFVAAKHALRRMGEFAASEAGFCLYWLRLFFVYGQGQRPDSLIPYVASEAVSGRSPKLRTPESRQDFIHVDDVAEAMRAVVETNPPGGVFNVGTGISTTTRRAAELVCETAAGPPPVWDEPAAGAGRTIRADISRLTRHTGWTPSLDLSSGIRKTLQWIEPTR